MNIKFAKSYVNIESDGNIGRFGGEQKADGFRVNVNDFQWIKHEGEATDADRIRLIYDTIKYCAGRDFKVLFQWMTSKPLELRGDIVIIGTPKRDRLELIFRGRKVTLGGECAGSFLFAAYTVSMVWEDGQSLAPEDKLELIRSAFRYLKGHEEIGFIDDENKGVFVNWRGEALAEVRDGKVIAERFNCACGGIPQHLELRVPGDIKLFTENLQARYKNLSLLKKKALFKKDNIYRCRYCGSEWSLEQNSEGISWKKL